MSQLSQYRFIDLVRSITGDVGGAVSPDAAGNINIVGSGLVVTTGTPNTITIGVGSGIATSYLTDDGNSAIPAANVLTIAGGVNLGTTSAGNTVTINLDDSINLVGSVTAGTDITTTGGNIVLPNTNSGGTQGTIVFGGNRFIHDYGSYNTFLGKGSGNTTFATADVTYNVGIGYNALGSLSNHANSNTAVGSTALGHYTGNIGANSAFGQGAGAALTTGDYNLFFGKGSGQYLVSGDGNCLIGTLSGALTGAGSAYTGSESYNVCIYNEGVVGESHVIRIGRDGSGDNQQNKCYVAGIYGRTPSGTINAAIIDNNGQLGSTMDLTLTSLTTTGSVTAGNIELPITTSSVGQIIQNGSRLLHTYGHATYKNTFLGENSGNFTLNTGGYPVGSYHNVGIGINSLQSLTGTGYENVGCGSNTLKTCTSGKLNVAVGSNTLYRLTTGEENTAFGYGCLANLVSGKDNLALGMGNPAYGSGYNYTSSESSNILLCNMGVTGESNKIRIGTTGSGDSQQNACYIAGIYGVTPSGTLNVTLVDSNGQLGSVTTLDVPQGGTGVSTLTDHGLLLGSGTGAITPLGVASNGQIPIGSVGSDPVLGNITSTYLDVTNGAGTINIDIDSNMVTTAVHGWNGAIIESPVVSVSSDGTTITFSVEKSGGGDLTCVFSDGFYSWDTTPADTISLTAGTDTVPQINYIYFLQSTKTLTVSTSDFPSAEHCPLATVYCQSAASLQTDGPYKVHAWTDHVKDSHEQGHVAHLNSWIRSQNATWISDVAPTLTITTNGSAKDNVIFTSTAGIVYQLHKHTFPAFTGTPDYYVVNDSTTAFDKVTDLNDLLTDSDGDSMSGRYFSLVIWGVVSEDGSDCKLMVNLPSGSYTTSARVQRDSKKYANFSIPAEFRGTGFLIAQYNLHHSTLSSGTWTEVNSVDLRGLYPSISAGSGTVTGSEFDDSVFRVYDNADDSKNLAFQVSSVATATTRTITMCDSDLDLSSPSFTGSVTAATGLTVSSLGRGVVQSSSSGVFSSSEGSDGQVLISSGSGAPSWSTVSAGTGISVTNGSNSISVASTGTTLNNQTGTTYTLVLADAGKFLTFTNASDITVTVPTNSSVAFPIGTQIGFSQGGAGQVTFTGAAPPTLRSADSALTTVKIYSTGFMIKIATDEWQFGGDLEA